MNQFQPELLLSHQVCTLPETLDDKRFARCACIDIPHIIRGSLEVTGGVVTLRDEDVVVNAGLERLVQWDWWAHELLLNGTKTLKAGCQLKVVVCGGFGDGGDNGDVVALWADVVG